MPGHRDPGAGAVNSGAGAAETGAGAVTPAPPHGDGPGGAGPAPRSRLWAKTTCAGPAEPWNIPRSSIALYPIVRPL